MRELNSLLSLGAEGEAALVRVRVTDVLGREVGGETAVAIKAATFMAGTDEQTTVEEAAAVAFTADGAG